MGDVSANSATSKSVSEGIGTRLLAEPWYERLHAAPQQVLANGSSEKFHFGLIVWRGSLGPNVDLPLQTEQHFGLTRCRIRAVSCEQLAEIPALDSRYQFFNERWPFGCLGPIVSLGLNAKPSFQ